MYYHARITIKPESAKGSPVEALELDLTHDDLLAKIVVPFLRGEMFFCGGTVVDPKKVRDIRLNETTQASPELFPFVRAERRGKGYVSWQNDEWYLADKGADVTRKVLDEAKQTVASKAAKVARPADSSRIFVVHGHDIIALDQTELLLRRWGLEPIILRDRANKGMTVIEKIEANAEVGYAIILLTPD